MQGFRRGVVIDRQQWAEGLFTFRIEAPVDPFQPGQFLNLGLDLGGAFVRRSYSVASAPGAPLEFFITRVEDGSLSPQLADLDVGAPLWVDPTARGFFTLEHVPDARELWLMATGTGLGPFVSILRSAAVWSRFERITLVHGVRLQAHLAYAAELAELARSHGDRLVRVPVVSRERGVPGALTGRITTTFVDGSLEARAGIRLDPERSHVMICGNPAMVEELSGLLAERGLRRHRRRAPGHVTFEKYW